MSLYFKFQLILTSNIAVHFYWSLDEISIFSNSSHLRWRLRLSDAISKRDPQVWFNLVQWFLEEKNKEWKSNAHMDRESMIRLNVITTWFFHHLKVSSLPENICIPHDVWAIGKSIKLTRKYLYPTWCLSYRYTGI